MRKNFIKDENFKPKKKKKVEYYVQFFFINQFNESKIYIYILYIFL